MPILPEEKHFPNGYLGNLTEQQLRSLEELKERLLLESEVNPCAKAAIDHGWGDILLLKILRATMSSAAKKSGGKRTFRVEPAFKRILDIMQWRNTYSVHERPATIEKYHEVYPYVEWKDRKAGTVVRVERLGLLFNNVKRSHFTTDEWLHNLGYNTNCTDIKLREIYEETGKDIPGYIVLADWKGGGLGILSRIGMLKMFNSIAADNFPETLDKVYIFNVPVFISKLVNLGKSFVDPVTMSKMEFIPGTPKELFRELFEIEKLPKEYGGESEEVLGIPMDAR